MIGENSRAIGSLRNLSSAYDEMTSATGALRPHWAGPMATIAALPPDQLAQRMARAAAEMAEDEIAVPPERARSLDLLPLILPDAEWQVIAAGLAQRARLLDAILADLYGPQTLIADGCLPPYLVLGNPAFLRPLRRVATIAGTPQLFIYAADLVRLPTGEWRVFADRTQAAAGVGYALQYRELFARTMPELFGAARVRPLQPFVALWQASLHAIGTKLADPPQIVLLTPGPYNDAYAEHVGLARALGITLAQSTDLVVRGDFLYLKTLAGLVRVDVIYRRIDGAYCDALELFERSALGVTGLVEVARAGHVAIVNMPGSAVVETPALMPFLPGLARRLLGEELRLPAITSWWCGQSRALTEVRGALDRFALHPVFAPDSVAIEPTLLSAEDRAAFAEKLSRQPDQFVARERVTPSLVPCLGAEDGPKPVVLRVLTLWHKGEWIALPGGVARIADRSIYRAGSRPGIVKDVWVLTEQDRDIAAPSLSTSPAIIKSRSADDLFWLGRYVERLDFGARLCAASLRRLSSAASSAQDQAALAGLADILKRAGWINFGVAAAPVTSAAFIDGVSRAAADGIAPRNAIDAIRRLSLAARDQLSVANWRTLNRLIAAATAQFAQAPLAPDRLLASLDGMIATTAALSPDGNGGGRFLDLGRSVERAIGLARTVQGGLTVPDLDNGLRLAFELCQTGDADVPRALLSPLARIAHHLDAPPAILSALIEAIEIFARTSEPPADRPAALARVLDRTIADVTALSDAITRGFAERASAS